MRSMRRMESVRVGFIVSLLIWMPVIAHGGEDYREMPVTGGATIKGSVKFSGKVPPPLAFEISKFPNARFCRKISDGAGNRLLDLVRVGEKGSLLDAVVFIRDIEGGKPFVFGGTDIQALDCRFLVQGGPSELTGVAVSGSDIRILNMDADPDDPNASAGVTHNPEAREIAGNKETVIFKLLSTVKGRVSKRKVELKSNKSYIKLKCDVHDYMQINLLPVRNPYYAVVGEAGLFSIDQVPPGEYTVAVWHPSLGMLEKKVKAGPNESVAVEFSFSP